MKFQISGDDLARIAGLATLARSAEGKPRPDVTFALGKGELLVIASGDRLSVRARSSSVDGIEDTSFYYPPEGVAALTKLGGQRVTFQVEPEGDALRITYATDAGTATVGLARPASPAWFLGRDAPKKTDRPMDARVLRWALERGWVVLRRQTGRSFVVLQPDPNGHGGRLVAADGDQAVAIRGPALEGPNIAMPVPLLPTLVRFLRDRERVLIRDGASTTAMLAADASALLSWPHPIRALPKPTPYTIPPVTVRLQVDRNAIVEALELLRTEVAKKHDRVVLEVRSDSPDRLFIMGMERSRSLGFSSWVKAKVETLTGSRVTVRVSLHGALLLFAPAAGENVTLLMHLEGDQPQLRSLEDVLLDPEGKVVVRAHTGPRDTFLQVRRLTRVLESSRSTEGDEARRSG